MISKIAAQFAVITGFRWTDERHAAVECSWLHNGESKSAWFNPKRLTLVSVQNDGTHDNA